MDRIARRGIDTGGIARGLIVPRVWIAATFFLALEGEFLAFHGAGNMTWLWCFAHRFYSVVGLLPFPLGSGHSVKAGTRFGSAGA